MSRRAIAGAVLLLLGLLALAARVLGPSSFDAASPPGTTDLRFECELSASPPTPQVGEPFALSLKIEGAGDLLSGPGALLLGFPHPYYALRSDSPTAPYPPAPPDPAAVRARGPNGPLPVSIRGVGYGRWHVDVALPRSADGAGVIELEVPGLIAPNRPLDRFEPLLLLEPRGDGHAWRICPELSVPVQAGPPARLVPVVQSRAAPGDEVWIALRQEDVYGNPVGALPASVDLAWRPAQGRRPQVDATVALRSVRPGVARGLLPAPPEGDWFAAVLGPGGRGSSDVLLVEPDAPKLAWTDLHGHSALADGWSSPERWYEHARDVAFLDAAALSEHDWQLDEGEWAALLAATAAAHDPPAFVSVPAVEINRVGHEVAYFFDPSVLPPSALAQGGATTLWAETDMGQRTARLAPPLEPLLSGEDVELVTHSSLAPSMGTAFPFERAPPSASVIELYSAHGSNECRSCPRSAWHPRAPGQGDWGSVRDALAAGYRLGFLAAGDSHDGRPGGSRWGAHSGGLGAVYWEEASRAGLQDALRSRRVYGTTGPRALVDFEVDGVGMGGVVPAAPEHRLRFRVLDAQPILGVTLVRDGVEWRTIDGPVGWVEAVDATAGASSYYLRAELSEGHFAWSSPVFVDP